MSTEEAKVVKETKSTKTVKTNAVAAVAKTKSGNPTYIQMIINAIRTLKETKGSSRQAIFKYIVANYNLDNKMAHIRGNIAIRTALENGILKHGKSNKIIKNK